MDKFNQCANCDGRGWFTEDGARVACSHCGGSGMPSLRYVVPSLSDWLEYARPIITAALGEAKANDRDVQTEACGGRDLKRPDIRKIFRAHVTANIRCQELCDRAIKLRAAGRAREARTLENKAKIYIRRMVEIERQVRG